MQHPQQQQQRQRTKNAMIKLDSTAITIMTPRERLVALLARFITLSIAACRREFGAAVLETWLANAIGSDLGMGTAMAEERRRRRRRRWATTRLLKRMFRG